MSTVFEQTGESNLQGPNLSDFLTQSFAQTPDWMTSVVANGNGNGNDQSLGNGTNGLNRFGGELLAGAGMDTVSDGLNNNGEQVLSAATILSLLEEGSFDYGSIFTDQAPSRTSDMVGGVYVPEESEEDGSL